MEKKTVIISLGSRLQIVQGYIVRTHTRMRTHTHTHTQCLLSLADEATALTLAVGLSVLWEEELGPVEYVHQHRQLSLHQRPQALLQRRHYVLVSGGHTHTQMRTHTHIYTEEHT